MAAGPVKHVVLFRFKTGTPNEKIRELIEIYKSLPGKIEIMKHFEWGSDVSVEELNDGFTHCFITTFDNAEGRDTYLPHPEHKKYVDVLFPHLDKVLVLDYVPEVIK